VGEAFPAVSGFIELVTLYHGTHGAIDEHDALLEQGEQRMGLGHGRVPED
jgi:hypothetical protein